MLGGRGFTPVGRDLLFAGRVSKPEVVALTGRSGKLALVGFTMLAGQVLCTSGFIRRSGFHGWFCWDPLDLEWVAWI